MQFSHVSIGELTNRSQLYNIYNCGMSQIIIESTRAFNGVLKLIMYNDI